MLQDAYETMYTILIEQMYHTIFLCTLLEIPMYKTTLHYLLSWAKQTQSTLPIFIRIKY
jgi:hypothetical protein